MPGPIFIEEPLIKTLLEHEVGKIRGNFVLSVKVYIAVV